MNFCHSAFCSLSYSGMRLNLLPSVALTTVCFTRPFPKVLKVCTCGALPLSLRGGILNRCYSPLGTRTNSVSTQKESVSWLQGLQREVIWILIPGVPKPLNSAYTKLKKHKLFRKHARIEPVIGHSKSCHRLGRYF